MITSAYLGVPAYTSALRYNLANNVQAAALSALPYSLVLGSFNSLATANNSDSTNLYNSALTILFGGVGEPGK